MPSFKEMLLGPNYAKDDADRAAKNDQYMKQANKDNLAAQQKQIGDAGYYEMKSEDANANKKAGRKIKIPSYKLGGRVKRTGLAYLHKGEKVVPVKKSIKRSPAKRSGK